MGSSSVTGNARQTFALADVPARPVAVAAARIFGAGQRSTTRVCDAADLEFLMANDSDPFNRWQAAQSYAAQAVADCRCRLAIRTGQDTPAPVGTRFAKALGATLSDESLDPPTGPRCLRCRASPTSPAKLGQDVDPEAIHKARASVFARASAPEPARQNCTDVYETHAGRRGPIRPTPRSTGKRALRNRALALLAETGNRGRDSSRRADHYDQC